MKAKYTIAIRNTPTSPSWKNTSTHMLCACITVWPWSMIHPSKEGSPAIHGVEYPQPISGSLDGALEHRLPDRLASGEVGAAAERGEDLVAQQPERVSTPPNPMSGVRDVVPGALAGPRARRMSSTVTRTTATAIAATYAVAEDAR